MCACFKCGNEAKWCQSTTESDRGMYLTFALVDSGGDGVCVSSAERSRQEGLLRCSVLEGDKCDFNCGCHF